MLAIELKLEKPRKLHDRSASNRRIPEIEPEPWRKEREILNTRPSREVVRISKRRNFEISVRWRAIEPDFPASQGRLLATTEPPT